jgi:subtilisin family serine protease
MEIGKEPGLGVRKLHDQGITGRGIGIAIIDQTLLVDHKEYKDRIRVYEETEDIPGELLEAQMHGPAVASIAVGKTVGVAPEADSYFIATAMCSQGTYETNDFSCLAKSIRRIVEINKDLPSGHKIRVLSISVGWGPESKGYSEVMAAVNDATAAGIFVINVSSNQMDGLKFIGIGRHPLSDPDDFGSYEPGILWRQAFFRKDLPKNLLLIPVDSRTTTSPTGNEDYVFYRPGGWSWAVPYLAGIYALAVQVNPKITPEEFWETAMNTGKTLQVQRDGKAHELGVILDPQALIEALENK